MIRRLVRIFVAGFCVVSLLAATSVACLWWECRSGQGYVADASFLGTYVSFELLPESQGGVVVLRHWPGPATFRVWSQRAYYNDHPLYWAANAMRTWHRFGLSGLSGQMSVYVRRETREPVRWPTLGMPPKSVIVPHGPMPAWTVGHIPPWLVIAGLLVPPVLIEGRRWRRLREHRRRVRLGLCLACGYDVRESPEKCPECGAAVPAPAKEAA